MKEEVGNTHEIPPNILIIPTRLNLAILSEEAIIHIDDWWYKFSCPKCPRFFICFSFVKLMTRLGVFGHKCATRNVLSNSNPYLFEQQKLLKSNFPHLLNSLSTVGENKLLLILNKNILNGYYFLW